MLETRNKRTTKTTETLEEDDFFAAEAYSSLGEPAEASKQLRAEASKLIEFRSGNSSGHIEVIATTQLSCECARCMHRQHGLPVAEGSGHKD